MKTIYLSICLLFAASFGHAQGKFGGGDGMGYHSSELLNQSLPVTLQYFTGKALEAQIELTWATNLELNNEGFAIEKRLYDGEFQPIGYVSGQGNSTVRSAYRFSDPHPVAGLNHYRLQQVDLDGSRTASEVIAVAFTQNDLSFTVFPNPVQNVLHIDLPELRRERGLVIRDVLGNAVLKMDRIPAEVQLGALSSGIYFVQIGGEVVKILKD